MNTHRPALGFFFGPRRHGLNAVDPEMITSIAEAATTAAGVAAQIAADRRQSRPQPKQRRKPKEPELDDEPSTPGVAVKKTQASWALPVGVGVAFLAALGVTVALRRRRK